MKRAQRRQQIFRRCFLFGTAVVSGTVFCILTLGKGESAGQEVQQVSVQTERWEQEATSTEKPVSGESSSQKEEKDQPDASQTDNRIPQTDRVFEIESEVLASLEKMAETDPKIEQLLEYPQQYPQELLEAVIENAETVDYVLEYPEKRDLPQAETIGSLTEGEIPQLIQWDERWGYTWYGDGLLGVTGCGPTSLAMVAAGLTGNEKITPAAVAEFAEENGYYVEGTGTSWSLMEEGCQAFGVRGRELILEKHSIISELEAGHPVICSMKPGDFTVRGHFVVFTGMEEGKIRIHDPNSKIRSEKLWDYEELEPQINNLWVFEKIV